MILYEYCLCNVFFLYQVELNFVYYEEKLVVRDKLRKFFNYGLDFYVCIQFKSFKVICIGKVFNEFLKN